MAFSKGWNAGYDFRDESVEVDFTLSEEQKMLIDLVRKMADREFKPKAGIIDEAPFP